MRDASGFVASPSPFNRKMAHPLADEFQLLLVGQHEIGKSLPPAIECRVVPEVMPNCLCQWPSEISALDYFYGLHLASKN